MRTSIAVLIATLGCSACAVSRESPVADGVYYGYEPMCSLDLTKPDQEWYHENVLTLKDAQVRIEKGPMFIENGEVWSSSSDGNFYVYEGTVERVGAREIVGLRLMECSYCPMRAGETLPSKSVREYVVGNGVDGAFELDRVQYSRTPDPRRHFVSRSTPQEAP